jgi:hypothetical protein
MQSLMTMVRIYTMYHPLRMFGYIGILLGLIGLAPIVRFVYLYFFESGAGHIQSLILGGLYLLMGFVTMLAAVLADLINFNRKLLESTLKKVRKLELNAETDQTLPAKKSVKLSEVSGGTRSLRRRV